jgi:hypothetical protein
MLSKCRNSGRFSRAEETADHVISCFVAHDSAFDSCSFCNIRSMVASSKLR